MQRRNTEVRHVIVQAFVVKPFSENMHVGDHFFQNDHPIFFFLLALIISDVKGRIQAPFFLEATVKTLLESCDIAALHLVSFSIVNGLLKAPKFALFHSDLCSFKAMWPPHGCFKNATLKAM